MQLDRVMQKLWWITAYGRYFQVWRIFETENRQLSNPHPTQKLMFILFEFWRAKYLSVKVRVNRHLLLAILLSDIWNADIWFPPSFLFSILLPRTETFEVLLLGHMLSRTLSIQDISYLRQKLSGTLATIRDSRFFFQFLAFPFSIFYLFQTNTLWSNMFSRHLMSFFPFFQNKYKKGSFKNYFYLGLTHLHLEISNFQT